MVLYIRVVTKMRRWLLAAAALVGLATVGLAGLAPVAAQAAVGSTCHFEPTPSALWLSDPAARINTMGGRYNLPGQTGVAYRLTGQFAHSVTEVFTAYNDLWSIPSPAYTLTDSQVVPDPGSVNPFVPGKLIEAPNRSFTIYLWPEGVPVPAGLGPNVILYPTVPQDPRDKGARWSFALRQYANQPGFPPITQLPKVTAVSTANPSQAVRCPLVVPGTYEVQIQSGLAHIRVIGPVVSAPSPAHSNKIYFTRYPEEATLGPDGFPSDGCSAYVVGHLSRTLLDVVTIHSLPKFFDNRNLPPGARMQNFPARYNSLTTAGYPSARSDNNFSSNAHVGKPWTTVWLPGSPNRLSRREERAVRTAAAARGFDVRQIQPDPATIPFTPITRPLGKQIPYPELIYRQKAISPTYRNGINSVPCWSGQPGNNWLDYPKQTSPAFFAKYASSPRNMGPHYIDGAEESVADFLGSK